MHSPGRIVTDRKGSRRLANSSGSFLLVLLTLPGLAYPQPQNTLLQDAAKRIENRDCATATELLAKILVSDPQSAPAYNLLGICRAQAAEYEGARKAFQKAIELNPALATAHVNLGNLLIKMQEDAAAIRQFQAAIAIEPDILTRNPASFVSFNIFGLCMMSDRKYEQAQRLFEHAIQINPRYLSAHVNLGNALVAQRLDAAALKVFLQAVTIDPNHFQAVKNIGLIYGRQEKFDLAVKYLTQARRLAPGDQDVALALAEAEISAGEVREATLLVGELANAGKLSMKQRETLALLWLDYHEPRQAADLVRNDPGLSAELYKLGYERAESAFDDGRYSEAGKILESIRDLQTPDAAFHDLLGSAYYAIDDPKKASQELQEAVRLEPADSEHYFKLGMVFLKHHTPDPAIYIYETAVKSRPDVPKLWLGLGLSYYSASRLEDAEPALRKALAIDPQYDVAYVVLGDLLEQSGRAVDALEVFRKAIESSSHSYLSYYYYGKLASKEGNEHVPDAIEKLRNSINLKPTFPEARYELGKVLADAGRTTEAIQQLDKSLELKPDLGQAHYQLARIYKRLGDHDNSAKHLHLFEEISKKAKAEDLIERLEVQIEMR
jgi:tetratricopeptide (TPR) repeat protein